MTIKWRLNGMKNEDECDFVSITSPFKRYKKYWTFQHIYHSRSLNIFKRTSIAAQSPGCLGVFQQGSLSADTTVE